MPSFRATSTALCPFASSTSACRSFRMICSAVCRFWPIPFPLASRSYPNALTSESDRSEGARSAVDLAQCSADALCYEDGVFDVVTAAGVLEYVPNDRKGLREMHRALRPGGTLILSVPVGEWFVSSFLRRHLGKCLLKKERNSFYHKSYTPSRFRRDLQEVGFRVHTTISHHFVFFPLDYLFPKLSARGDLLLTRLLARSRWFASFGKTFVAAACKPG
ncbi:MAG: SAM-dependent methyltransferase [Gammaproteobacteria bacterium]|nr:MAG: SAM-dependent methyltransferase [Gammaproteobacteria bacterium]